MTVLCFCTRCVGTSVKKNEDQTAAGEIKLDQQLTLKQQEHYSEAQQVISRVHACRINYA